MPKPKAPRWLTEAFRDGVDERNWTGHVWSGPTKSAYPGAMTRCWLAQHDERRRPCSGPLERFHFIPRQRVENALGALLYPAGQFLGPPGYDEWTHVDPAEIILLAAWDPRNGGIGCEAHHRRFDSHLTPGLIVPREALPAHLTDFATDWGLESQLEHRFPQ